MIIQESTLLMLLTFSTFYLTGLIWTIQMVHYPSFSWVVQYSFAKFEVFHQKQMSKIVVVPMLLELTLSVIGLFVFSSSLMAWVNMVSVGLIWAVTFFVSVPCHSVLSRGYNEVAANKLTLTNWYRTVMWTLRALVLSWLTLTQI